LAFVASGCATTQRNVSVVRGQYLPPEAEVTVHVVGVNASDLPRWEAMSMTKYWDTAQTVVTQDRAEAVKTGRLKATKLAATAEPIVVLSKDDAVWEQWKKADVSYLLVLSDLPRSAEDMRGSEDPRRRVFKLDTAPSPQDLVLEVNQGGLATIKGIPEQRRR
jgi:hypothetical protein